MRITKTIHIPADAERIISTSSKGDQSKWRVGDQWAKQVLLSQLNDPSFKHLFVEGSESNG